MQQTTSNSNIKRKSMLILALLPILAWYKIPFPVSLGYAFVLVLSLYSILRHSFKKKILSTSFWVVYGYVSINWMYSHGFIIKSVFPPGGWQFFIFFLSLVWGILNFEFDYLIRYMRWIVLASAVLFWIQFLQRNIIGTHFCFVPNLTGSFIYQGMTYSELVEIQLKSSHPCSIFLEKSYMAYYYISYLSLVWFGDNLRKNWVNKESLFIVLSLIALKSGSGIVGLIVLFSVKIYSEYWTSNSRNKLSFIFIGLPLIAGLVYIYVNSEMGIDVINRSEELSTEGTSGYSRVVGGYAIFDMMTPLEQMIGKPDVKDIFGVENQDGSVTFYINGIQTVLIYLGYIGILLYFIFYASLFRNVGLSSRMCIIIFFTMSLLESNYLNPYMMLLTIIPSAEYYDSNKLTRE